MENLNNQAHWILQEKYKGKLTVAAKKDIARLKAGEPIDHIIGFTDFLGCKILVDKNVLIPRVETEFWVEEAIEELKNATGPIRVLDMFAGSGCIGISIMRQIPGARVTFAESEPEAVAQIKKNCLANKLSGKKYKLIRSDVFSNVRGTFDYIVANPPYIPTVRKNKIQSSVIGYEPHAALFGGEDGLMFIKQFLASAKNHLSTGRLPAGRQGKIYMEFDSPQKPAIATLLQKLAYKTWDFHKDQYGKWRYVVVQ